MLQAGWFCLAGRIQPTDCMLLTLATRVYKCHSGKNGCNTDRTIVTSPAYYCHPDWNENNNTLIRETKSKTKFLHATYNSSSTLYDQTKWPKQFMEGDSKVFQFSRVMSIHMWSSCRKYNLMLCRNDNLLISNKDHRYLIIGWLFHNFFILNTPDTTQKP